MKFDRSDQEPISVLCTGTKRGLFIFRCSSLPNNLRTGISSSDGEALILNPDRPLPKANTGSTLMNLFADAMTALTHLERRFDPFFRPVYSPRAWQRRLQRVIGRSRLRRQLARRHEQILALE